jgi:hypothetical protein
VSTVREAVVDASVYAAINGNPGITANGVRYTWKGFAVAEILEALERLTRAGLVVAVTNVDGGPFWSARAQ